MLYRACVLAAAAKVEITRSGRESTGAQLSTRYGRRLLDFAKRIGPFAWVCGSRLAGRRSGHPHAAPELAKILRLCRGLLSGSSGWRGRPPEAVLERRRRADAPVNDGSFVRRAQRHLRCTGETRRADRRGLNPGHRRPLDVPTQAVGPLMGRAVRLVVGAHSARGGRARRRRRLAAAARAPAPFAARLRPEWRAVSAPGQNHYLGRGWQRCLREHE